MGDYKRTCICDVCCGANTWGISPKEYKTKNVEVKGVRFYKNSDIATIRDIPDNITGIEYNCTLLETKETRIEELIFG